MGTQQQRTVLWMLTSQIPPTLRWRTMVLQQMRWGRARQVCCSASSVGAEVTLTRFYDPNDSAL